MSALLRLLFPLLLLPAIASAQTIEVSGVVTVTHGDHRVDAGLGVERATGLLAGAAAL